MSAVAFKDVETFRNRLIDEIKSQFHLEESQALAIFQAERTNVGRYWYQRLNRGEGNLQELINLMMTDEDDREDTCRD